jgi:exopolysaccharide biosynthesis polyprenyl glycosylphosphotransferase
VRIGLALYMLADYLSAALAWFFLWVYRQQAAFSFTHFSSKDCFFTLLLIPGLWMLFHLFSGAYFNPYRKSRVNEIYRTLIVTFFGTVLLYFPFIQNDAPVQLTYYYKTFLVYYALQFCLTGLFRLIHLSRIKAHINRERFGYNTLIIGGNQQAIKLYQDICKNEVHLGYLFKGFVYADESGQNGMSNYLPKLGSIDQLEKIIDEHAIEEVVIAIDTSEHDRLQYILSQLSHRQVIIKITPDLYDIISGSVKTSNVFGAVLIEIYPELMPDWQRVFKRAIDVMASIVGLVLLSPLYLFSAIKVKLASPGAIFYKQERIGLYGKPFWIYKFRSMVMDAEKAGPALSSENDPRITAWGKVMRKWRIDELPQLYNILRGDMSLVGPRPERKYYIDIISKTNPHYKYLHKVKPGLSSWGMVKFGYAETPEQMIERMKYDLLYIKNCSLVLDVKIMFYTILVILQGRGK